MTAEGELELWINPEGRDTLIKELQGLNERNDHFHFGAYEGAEVQLKANPYRPTDTIIHSAKVLFRTDDWDQTYFPHVLVKEE